jgi:hypothetical protein
MFALQKPVSWNANRLVANDDSKFEIVPGLLLITNAAPGIRGVNIR